jgi:anti-sigma B factor antagonist
MKTFKLTEMELESGDREILVEGELDLAVADKLREAIASSPSEQTLINLEACGFIDSTGIAVIVQAHQVSVKEGRRVVVHSPSDQVLRVLSVTGLTDNGLVFASRKEALSPPSRTA